MFEKIVFIGHQYSISRPPFKAADGHWLKSGWKQGFLAASKFGVVLCIAMQTAVTQQKLDERVRILVALFHFFVPIEGVGKTFDEFVKFRLSLKTVCGINLARPPSDLRRLIGLLFRKIVFD